MVFFERRYHSAHHLEYLRAMCALTVDVTLMIAPLKFIFWLCKTGPRVVQFRYKIVFWGAKLTPSHGSAIGSKGIWFQWQIQDFQRGRVTPWGGGEITYLRFSQTLYNTGWAQLIRSHSSARFSFELSGNSNYIIHCNSNYVQNFELEINSI